MTNQDGIYELTVLYCKHPLTYPKPVEHESLGFFTSIERAEVFLRLGVESGQVGWFELKSEPFVLGYQLAEWALDDARALHRRCYYAPDGRCQGDEPMDEEPQPWAGRLPETCRFKVGDIVQVMAYNTIDVGIVAALPLSPEQVNNINARAKSKGVWVDQSEDRYFIWLVTGEHVHAAEGSLCAPMVPVDGTLAQALRGWLEPAPNDGPSCSRGL